MFSRPRLAISTALILWGVLLGWEGLSRGESSSEAQMVRAAVTAYEDKDYPFAESQLTEFLQKFPRSLHRPDMTYLLGRVYFLQEKFLEAREAFLRIIHDDQASSVDRNNGFFWLAESCVQLDRWGEAKAYYLNFIAKDSESPFLGKSLHALALISLKEKAWTEAEAYFRRGLRAYPNSQYRSQQQYYRGLIYSQWNNYHRAVQLLKDAIFSPPGLEEPLHKDALFQLAENRLRLGQFQLALPYYRDFYEAYPQDSLAPFALYGAGWCELSTGQKEVALKSFQRLIKQFPKSDPYPQALHRIGEIHLEQKDYEKARIAFNQLVKEFPDSEWGVSALVNLGWCHLNIGDFDELTRVAQRLLKLPSGQKEKTLAQLLLGEAHFQKGQYEEGLPYFYNLLNVPSQRENALYKISRSYFYGGEYKDAITNLEILLLEYPDAEHLKECFYLKGQAAYRSGETEKAIASFSQILAKEDRDAWTVAAFYELGRIYYERKDLKKAKDLFSGIVRTVPDAPTAILASYYLGIIYFKENNPTDALLHLHDALQSENRAIKAECYYRIGRIYLEKEAYDLSLHHFQIIVDTFTDQRGWVELALMEIGNARLAGGDLAEAGEAFQKVLEISKDPNLRAVSERMLHSIEESKPKP